MGRLRAPIYITHDGAPMRPDVVFCLDTDARVIVGAEVTYPTEPPTVVLDCLQRAMEKPLCGQPRRPASVRVSDGEVAAALRRGLGDGMQVQLGETPELDDALRVFAQNMHKDEPAPSYLEHGRVGAQAVADFFAAAARLYRAAPWETVADDALIAVTIPALGLRDACVSVIGALGQSFGLLVFDSLEERQRFVTSGENIEVGRGGDMGAQVFAISFEQGSELARALRREIGTHGWAVAGPQAYPCIMRIDPDHICLPLTEEDYILATATAAGIARFFEKHRPLFLEAEPQPVAEVFHYGSDPASVIEVTAPHPNITLVYRDVAGNRGPGSRFASGVGAGTSGSATGTTGGGRGIETGIGSGIGASSSGAGAVGEAGIDGESDLLAEAEAEDLEAQGILDSFLDAQCAAGERSEVWLNIAELVCDQLFGWKIDDMDGTVQRWTAAQIEYFMLEVFPDRVGGDAAAFRIVPDILRELFIFMADEGRLRVRTADAVATRIGKIRGKFLQRMREDAESAVPLVQISMKRPPRDSETDP